MNSSFAHDLTPEPFAAELPLQALATGRKTIRVPKGRLLLLAALLPCALTAAGPRPVPPLEAELLIPVSARGTRVGKPIYARALTDWEAPGCRIRTGAILRGRLIGSVVHSRKDRISSISLVFETAECSAHRQESLPLTVAAILAPDLAVNSSPPLNEAVGISIGETAGPAGRSVTSAASVAWEQLNTEAIPRTVAPGSVIGLRGFRLSVGTGPEGSSVLSITGQDARLDRGSRLYLIARSTSPTVAAPTAGVAAAIPTPALPPVNAPPAPPPPPPPPAPVDETDLCSPPNCSIELPDAGALAPAHARASVSMASLGYAPRLTHEVYAFDHEAAIVWLGPSQILCTFNVHALVLRGDGNAGRLVRVALLDAAAMRVTRTLDWRITDDRQYLWPLGDGRVLAHVGDELRVYGPDLRMEHHIKLGAPLSFLTSSPSGMVIAAGIEHERHSPEMHREIEEALGSNPEEDIEVRLLDANLRLLGSWQHAGHLNPPILTNSGEIRLLWNQSRATYRILEYGWDKQQRELGTVVSVCTPALATLPPNLILISGCARMTKDRWQRVLTDGGRPVLTTHLTSSELEHHHAGLDSANLFALGVVEASKALIVGSAFSSADLTSERISVYRARDGVRMMTIHVASPSTADQTFALSPDGSRVAVISGSLISLYTLP